MELLKIGNHVIFSYNDIWCLGSITNNQHKSDYQVGVIGKSSESKELLDKTATIQAGSVEMVFKTRQDIKNFVFEDYPELSL